MATRSKSPPRGKYITANFPGACQINPTTHRAIVSFGGPNRRPPNSQPIHNLTADERNEYWQTLANQVDNVSYDDFSNIIRQIMDTEPTRIANAPKRKYTRRNPQTPKYVTRKRSPSPARQNRSRSPTRSRSPIRSKSPTRRSRSPTRKLTAAQTALLNAAST